MKKIITILIISLIEITTWAQAPQAFKYQALARAIDGSPMTNEILDIRLTLITDDPQTGIIVYEETHQTTTTARGLFSLNVGMGSSTDDFAAIDWGTQSHFMKVEMKLATDNNYIEMGTSPLLSVPYALHAETADNVDDADADPGNELQDLSLDGTEISISDGNSIDLGPIIPPGGTDDQTISLDGTNLSIESGNSVDLIGLQDGVEDADADPVNELQNLSLDGTQIIISEGNSIDLAPIIPPGGTDDQQLALSGTNLSIESGNSVDLSGLQDGVEDADADPVNELQNLSLDGTQVIISEGNSIDLAPIIPPGGTDDQQLTLSGTNLSIESGNSVDLSGLQDGVEDADADPVNELQNLSLDGTQVIISEGNSIDLAPIIPPGGTDDQQLTLSGTNLSIESGNSVDLSGLQDSVEDADADPENEIQHLQVDTLDVILNAWLDSIYLDGLALVLSESEDTVKLYDLNPFNELQILDTTHSFTVSGAETNLQIASPNNGFGNTVVIKDTDFTNELQSLSLKTLNNPCSDVIELQLKQKVFNPATGAINLAVSSSLPIPDSDPINELQKLQIGPINAFDSKLELLRKICVPDTNQVPQPVWVPFLDPVTITDTDPINEIQKLDLVVLNYPWGDEYELQLLKKVVDPNTGVVSWALGEKFLLPDPDPDNELQKLEMLSISDPCKNDKLLQLGHEVVDPVTGVTSWVVDDSLEMPDSDPVNELQKLQISPFNVSDSKLEILRKDCIPDGEGNNQPVWLPFNDPVIITDTDPANEIQTLSYNPFNRKLYISDGNHVDLSAPVWEEWVNSNTAQYNGTAIATVLETESGSVKADVNGLSRNDPATGKNLSNICSNEVNGSSVGGRIEILNNDENISGLYQTCPHGSGTLNTFGPDGGGNVAITHENGFPDRGLMGVVDANDFVAAGFYIDDNDNGILFAWNKSFRMKHPVDPSKEIWYASLEGPEGAAYERGTSKLENGSVFVSFSEHFREVINPETMTVMLTPLSSETYGLAVVEKKSNGFMVKELVNGQGNFEFDWEVKSIRKGLEDFEVIRDRRKLAASHREHSNGTNK